MVATQCTPENGISGVISPIEALLGVFLGSAQPNLTPPPPDLDFSPPMSRDYLTLAPELKQVFFVGDGRTSSQAAQRALAPPGATRLYLGTMDGSGWYNNGGSFLVIVKLTAPDHFVLYKTKPTSDSPKFAPFAPVTLADQFRAVDYQVVKPKYLGLPADKNGEGIIDGVTHLMDYQVKPVAGSPKFQKVTDVQIGNQCNTLRLEVTKPTSILVPTLSSRQSPPANPPGINDHQLDHYLCYKAKPQAKLADGTKLPKFPKGIQVDVEVCCTGC